MQACAAGACCWRQRADAQPGPRQACSWVSRSSCSCCSSRPVTVALTRLLPLPPPTPLARADAPAAHAGIEDLREKREQILKQIVDEESEKAKIQTELTALTQRLSRINESLARKVRVLQQPGLQGRSDKRAAAVLAA